MPLANIRLVRRDLPTTAAQKAALIAGVTQRMQQVLDKRTASVTVIIDEVDLQTDSCHWGQRSKGPAQA
ncbi:MAG: tautomerase family protein [Acidovorax sp.]|nr:tautomerase family protein [Acidovorax sp.]